jgi:integrase
MLTGCRLREILRLEWSQIDWARGLLVLPDSKTGKKTVVLGAAALSVLERLPRIGRFVIASSTAGQKGEKPRADLSKPWKALCKASELEGVRLHDLRHSAAAVGASAGLSLHQIGGLLGHKQVRTTAKYAHLIDDAQRAAADRIGNTVADALGLGGNVVKLDGRK